MRLGFAPLAQTRTQILGFDTQRLADHCEREQRVPVFVAEPVFGFPEHQAARTAAGTGVLLQAAQRILENREHETLDRAHGAVVAPFIVKLIWRQDGGREKRTDL